MKPAHWPTFNRCAACSSEPVCAREAVPTKRIIANSPLPHRFTATWALRYAAQATHLALGAQEIHGPPTRSLSRSRTGIGRRVCVIGSPPTRMGPPTNARHPSMASSRFALSFSNFHFGMRIDQRAFRTPAPIHHSDFMLRGSRGAGEIQIDRKGTIGKVPPRRSIDWEIQSTEEDQSSRGLRPIHRRRRD